MVVKSELDVASDIKESITSLNTAWYTNKFPLDSEEEKLEAFPDIECMTIVRFYANYIKSKGHDEHRQVLLGKYSVDIKLRLRYLTADPDNAKEHYIVIRGQTTVRRRPNSKRFLLEHDKFQFNPIKITSGDYNWLGETWWREFNKRNLPSL